MACFVPIVIGLEGNGGGSIGHQFISNIPHYVTKAN